MSGRGGEDGRAVLPAAKCTGLGGLNATAASLARGIAALRQLQQEERQQAGGPILKEELPPCSLEDHLPSCCYSGKKIEADAFLSREK